jgi:hypothetical protein
MPTPSWVVMDALNEPTSQSRTRSRTNPVRQNEPTRKYRNGRRIRHINPAYSKGHLHPDSILSRLPNGMPISTRPNSNVPDYLFGHRLGTRRRTREERFLQQGRQMQRRNPALAAKKIAPTRLFNANDPDNVSKTSAGWVEGENMYHIPPKGHWGAVGFPIAEASAVRPRRAHPRVGTENELYLPWLPLAARVRRPMTSAELDKEERFRQETAEQAQSRGKKIYRSPRNISRTPRRVKSLSLKSKRKSRKKDSF